jgi:hypothetical protein
MKQARSKAPRSKAADARRSNKPETDTANKATTEEFEREDMGIAPKE